MEIFVSIRKSFNCLSLIIYALGKSYFGKFSCTVWYKRLPSFIFVIHRSISKNKINFYQEFYIHNLILD